MTDALGAAATGARVRLNIGEVLDLLRPDFPGVTIPKIRFLEDKGLVKPERTPAGYLRGQHAHAQTRLAYLTLQGAAAMRRLCQ